MPPWKCAAWVEGHGSGLTDLHDISAFVAAGLSSDHEVWALDEAWDRLKLGLFVELRPFSYDVIMPGLIERGLEDWSNIAFTTDDRSASETLETGASDHNVRHAIHYGLAPRDRHPVRHHQPGTAHADRPVGGFDYPRSLCRYRAARRPAEPLDQARLCRWPTGLGAQDLYGAAHQHCLARLGDQSRSISAAR